MSISTIASLPTNQTDLRNLIPKLVSYHLCAMENPLLKPVFSNHPYTGLDSILVNTFRQLFDLGFCI